MLLIGGSRDKQHITNLQPGCHEVRLPIYRETMPRSTKIELYVEKKVWRKGHPTFSVMVLNGAEDILDNYLKEYNKRH